MANKCVQAKFICNKGFLIAIWVELEQRPGAQHQLQQPCGQWPYLLFAVAVAAYFDKE